MSLLKPQKAEKIGDQLAIIWDGGEESFIPLEALREACPCATCQGEPDILGRVVQPIRSGGSPRKYDLVAYAWVGGYGFRPEWADGHNVGIFTFQRLKELAV